MALLLCPADIISTITSFLDNKSNSKLISSCNTLKTHGKKHGYLTSLKADYTVNMMDFINLFCKHSKSVSSILINGIDDPHQWIPKYVEKVFFEHCSIKSNLDPGKEGYITKTLKITDYHRLIHAKPFRINWKSFKNLENLELYVNNIDLDGIDACKKLKKVNINTLTLKITSIDNIFGNKRRKIQ